MEKINSLRKHNLVYPKQSELKTLMKNSNHSVGRQEAWGESHPHQAFVQIHDNRASAHPAPIEVDVSYIENIIDYQEDEENEDDEEYIDDDCDYDESEVCQEQPMTRSKISPAIASILDEVRELSEEQKFRSQSQEMAIERLSFLFRRFSERTARMQERMRNEVPPSPTSQRSISPPPKKRSDSLQSVKVEEPVQPEPKEDIKRKCWRKCNSLEKVFDPQGALYLSWLFTVTICYCYNCWAVPLRASFPYQTPSNTPAWLLLDYFCDIIYIIDLIAVKPRLSYLTEGFWVEDPAETRRNYLKKLQFKMDLISLLPLDFFYFYYGTSAVLFRIPRLLKIQTFFEFYTSMDRVFPSPFVVRVGRTLTNIFFMIHLNACAYYRASTYEGIGTNGWVFSGVGNAYVRCFYFATKCATSIGKNPKPENEFEYVFMTCAWLMGVFVFALLLGQIRDIIATATRSQTEYKKLVDETMEYLRRLNLPLDLQRRVATWFKFTWEQQRTLDESRIINTLPINLKTDVAINVHIQILSKVQLFTDCDEALLRELVLKLKGATYLPKDLICRKGDVGKDMYIVKMGQVQVMGGPENQEVLATLSEGSVFGEISLLGMDGGNRRTADVRSKGYSNLFVLSKMDLDAALVYHPDAQQILGRKAKSLMRKNAARLKTADIAEVIIPNPTTPEKPSKLMEAIMQVVPEDSGAGLLLRKGSRANLKRKNTINRSGQNITSETVTNQSNNSLETENVETDEQEKKGSKVSFKKRRSLKRNKYQIPFDNSEYLETDDACYCDRLRRRTFPKNLRRRKVPMYSRDTFVTSGLYSARNCLSEPSFEALSKIVQKEESLEALKNGSVNLDSKKSSKQSIFTNSSLKSNSKTDSIKSIDGMDLQKLFEHRRSLESVLSIASTVEEKCEILLERSDSIKSRDSPKSNSKFE